MSREYKPEFMDPENAGDNTPQAPGSMASVPSTSGLASPQKQRKASSGFTNLRKYFQANQGNQLIQNIAQPAQQQLGQAQQTLAESQQKFNTQLENQQRQLQAAQEQAAKAKQYIDVGDKSLIGVSALPQDATEEQKTKAALDANKAAQNALMRMRDYSYSGPRELENAAKIAQDQFAIQDFAKATKTDAGRGALLQSVFGKGGQYTAGARGLDQFLLGADKSNLNQLRNIRAGAQKLGQDIKGLDIETAGKVGGAQGNVQLAKDVSRQEMQKLRDKKRADLEAEAAAYNAAQRADIAELTMDELRKYIPELTGYELANAPVPAGQVGLTEVNPEALNYINLFRNKEFEEHQKLDNPAEVLHRRDKEAGGFGHRDWNHDMYGTSTPTEALVQLDALKPLIKQEYTDNTWESINRDALERRNILSQVLADQAEQGLVTPKERQEIQTTAVKELVDQLKEIPTDARDEYAKWFFTTGPGNNTAISRWKELGYTNPLDMLNELSITYRMNASNLPGFVRKSSINMGESPFSTPYNKPGNQPITTNDFEYNPETGKMRFKYPQKTGMLVNPKTGVKIPMPKPNQGAFNPGNEADRINNIMRQLSQQGFVKEMVSAPEIDPSQFMSSIVGSKYGANRFIATPGLAEKQRELYIQDQLKKALGDMSRDKLKYIARK